MGRFVLFLLLAAAVLVLACASALFIVLGAVVLVVLAWRRPDVLRRVSEHPRLARLPAALRAPPLRFAAMVAGLALVLVWAGSAVGGGRSVASSAHSDPTLASATSTPFPPPTIEATTTARVTATPEATPTATPEPTPTPKPTLAPTPQPTTVAGGRLTGPTGPTQVATVVSITDGDTIRVSMGGTEYRVRYIGMDTPETHFGTEWMGPEAADANAELVAGRQVVLEKDVSETDRFGRLLRYVWLHDDSGWLLVNLELVRLGFAQVATYPPDVKYIEPLFVPAQREAREAGIGLWGPGGPSATPAPAAPVPFAAGSCEPSYPDMCIKIGTSDLDCGDITARRFRVLWDVPNPDPHRFDADRNGIGCES